VRRTCLHLRAVDLRMSISCLRRACLMCGGRLRVGSGSESSSSDEYYGYH
jgi:hypothetical protein